MRDSILVIGDVHGRLDLLSSLVQQARDDGFSGRICMVGDLVDRGPDAAGVVRFIRQNDIMCVLGNHEEMMLGSFDKRAGTVGNLRSQYLWLNPRVGGPILLPATV